MGDTGFLRGLSDAAGDFVGDDIVVSGIAAEEAADADYGIVFLCFGQGTRGGGNFEGSGDADDLDIFVAIHAAANQSVDDAGKQALGDERIKTADDDRESFAVAEQIAFQG